MEVQLSLLEDVNTTLERQAREEARIIKNDARVEASEMRLKAQHDAYQLLASVEDQLSEACKSIRRRRSDLGDENE